MEKKTYKGAELADALKKGDLANTGYMVSGIVKESANKECIAFSISNGRQWIDIPTKMIETAEQVLIDSSESDNPTVKITFSEPKDIEIKALLALLLSSMDNLSRHLSTTSSTVTTSIARRLGGTGYSCCKTGKAYPCGCYPNGEPMICCDDYEPCTVIGNPSVFVG